MFTRKARAWVIGVALILLGWTIYQQVYELSAFVFIGISMLVWGYFKEGTVVMAAREFHRRNYEAAEELLQEIEDPNKLGRHRRGFYEFIYGNIELNRQNYSEAEKHFQIASLFPLRNQNDKAIVLMHLANLSLRKKEYERARTYLDTAKRYRISLRVKNIIQKIETELNQAA